MKITLPENLETPFVMLMKGIPEALQADEQFRNAVLVYLKLGGVSMARQYVQSRVKFLDFDPLEIDTGFRFPRLQETETDEESEDDDNEDDSDDDEDDDDDR